MEVRVHFLTSIPKHFSAYIGGYLDASYPDANGMPGGKPDPAKVFNLYPAAVKKLTGRNFE